MHSMQGHCHSVRVISVRKLVETCTLLTAHSNANRKVAQLPSAH